VILAVLAALATGRPVLDEAADAACPPAGLRAGAAFTPRCDGIAVSLARAAWLAAMVPHADEQVALRRLDAAACADSLAAATAREDYWRRAAEGPPARLSPVAAFGIGAASGVATVLLGALAVRAVAEAPLYSD
jgi:hypothetical protein